MELWEIEQLQSPAPQTFALLLHLSKDPALQTGSRRCTPNSRLFIMHCHRGYYPPPPPLPPPPPPFSSPHPLMFLLALHPIAARRYQSTATRLAPSASSSQTTQRCTLPRHHTRQRWLEYHAGRAGGKNGQTGRQADRHPAMWFQCNFGKHIV